MAQEKFKYVIICTDDGSVTGTNDGRVAEEFARDIDNYVIDTELCLRVQEPGGPFISIKEQTLYNLPPAESPSQG